MLKNMGVSQVSHFLANLTLNQETVCNESDALSIEKMVTALKRAELDIGAAPRI
ncbi:hypothetical protein QMA69_24545 [Burkholderia pseudomallei]|uniref:hypothetical protein n=1 Tax=Burkholderia pseudomallei TaxID=28450 RepID=UPI002DB56A67|nr:hypothetical protein [Burkholderia pseudomallei]MEB5487769.1 hypothetical protein [Burkholderia pseudomallei]MEB5494368.1 hypothetical protein [Burkholderia pseudomallei]MEB5500884.1 hypothetical protein [Burkholderia pseudomallei]MEB5506476.1 hypothetical protein [Burkholderia pseudomallei]MEB5513809.1 hypothetical protein [Burkholderia pseudomallei]